MLSYLLEKEFKQIFRNAFLSKLLIVMPVMFIIIFPYVTNQEVRDVKVGVVDHDHSPLSRRLVEKVGASPYFRLSDVSATYPEALDAVAEGESDLVLAVPCGFERDLVRGEVVEVLVAANSVNGTRGTLGAQYLSTILSDYSGELREAAGAVPGAVLPVFRTEAGFRFNPTLDYKVFMVPGLLVMLLTVLCCAFTALNIVGEKEAGTIEQINVSPVPRALFILAKLLPNWIIGLLALVFGMLAAWLVHGVTPTGSLGTILLFAVLYVCVVSAAGMVVSNYSNTMQQAMFVMFFFLIIFMITCGLFTPIKSMPDWMQWCVSVNPLKYFVQAMRLIYLKGSGFVELLPEFAWLCGFAVVFNVWAVWSYKKSL